MKPPSLLDLFEGPDGMVGQFGWVCGYSGDSGFLDAAAERFTRSTFALRAYKGRVVLAVMLDPTQPALSPLDLPGVAHLALHGEARNNFRLLHAKIALLGFRIPERPQDWCLRLIVSTGNWTTQTLEDSLDLVWSIDVRSGDEAGGDHAQRCADLRAAYRLLEWLFPFFDQSLLRGAQEDMVRVQRWLSTLDDTGATPRFFDNREAGLLEQIPSLIRTRARRSYLAMGSGFFEGDDSGKLPRVLEQIVNSLERSLLLTKSAGVSIFVNDAACQSVATATDAIRARGWTVRAPVPAPDVFGTTSLRRLHAKFLFGYNRQSNVNACTSSWVYLGSGNFTGPGFLLRAGAGTGNLEAGVVFEPGALLWEADAKDQGTPVATRLLPIEGEDATEARLHAGERPPLNDALYLAAPVTALRWTAEHGGVLTALDPVSAGLEVLDPLGKPCEAFEFGWRWMGDCPQQVAIRWQDSEESAVHQRMVPVFDEWYRLAARPLRTLQFDELDTLIDAFPTFGVIDEEDLLEDFLTGSPEQRDGSSARVASDRSAVRQVMGQIERIAAKQSALEPDDWTEWCFRLEQLLVQARESDALAAYRALGLNPLSILKAVPFRPRFARDNTSEAGRQYEAAIDRVARAWRVDKLVPIGELL